MTWHIYAPKMTNFRLSCLSIFVVFFLVAGIAYINELSPQEGVEGLVSGQDPGASDVSCEYSGRSIGAAPRTRVDSCERQQSIGASCDTWYSGPPCQDGDNTCLSSSFICGTYYNNVGLMKCIDHRPCGPADDDEGRARSLDQGGSPLAISGMCTDNADPIAHPDVMCPTGTDPVHYSGATKGRTTDICCQEKVMCSGNEKSSIGLDFLSTEDGKTYQYNCAAARSYGDIGNTLDIKQGAYKIRPSNRPDPGCPVGDCSKEQDKRRHETCCIPETCAAITCGETETVSTMTLNAGDVPSKTTCCPPENWYRVQGDIIWEAVVIRDNLPWLALPLGVGAIALILRLLFVREHYFILLCILLGSAATGKWYIAKKRSGID